MHTYLLCDKSLELSSTKDRTSSKSFESLRYKVEYFFSGSILLHVVNERHLLREINLYSDVSALFSC